MADNMRTTMPGSLPLRIIRFIKFQPNDDMGTACWIWTGGTFSDGAPRTHDPDKKVSTTAASVIYKMVKGDSKGNLRNICKIQMCVNPNHRQDTGVPCCTKCKRPL
jgi:hypothetical protein